MLQDGQPSTRQLLNSSQTVVASYTTDAFGNSVAGSGTAANPFQIALIPRPGSIPLPDNCGPSSYRDHRAIHGDPQHQREPGSICETGYVDRLSRQVTGDDHRDGKLPGDEDGVHYGELISRQRDAGCLVSPSLAR